MTTPIIEFSNVSKRFRKHFWTATTRAVDNCSFTVVKDSVTGFVGPNGAGKTTSIKMILGLVRPDLGTIRINGLDPRLTSSRNGVSFLSERPYFYDHLTVSETLRFAFRLQGGIASPETTAVSKVLDEVELGPVSGRMVKDLSKGMAQRLSMAQALLCDPGVMILDEPMSGLDPLGRRLFRTIISTLGRQGKTVFFSSHILDDVESLCTDVVVLSRGRCSYQGAISRLLDQGFLGTELTVRGLRTDVRTGLAGLGFSVTGTETGESVIFVGKDQDLRKCQAFLYDHGVVCETISKRNASLEDIIYKQHQGD
jgi:ABC-2 type transport system ATP-binding protein